MDFYFLSFQMKERNSIRFAERTFLFFAAGDEYFVVSSGNNEKILSIVPAPLNLAKLILEGIQRG